MSLLIAGKMFTTGRIIFAVLFALTFIGFMIFSYRKDASNHQKYYKDSAKYVAIALVIVILLLFASKYFLKD